MKLPGWLRHAEPEKSVDVDALLDEGIRDLRAAAMELEQTTIQLRRERSRDAEARRTT